MALLLNAQNLTKIAKTARIPSYDRSKLTAGILHVGVGNFHRAHQALYLQDLFNQGRDYDWALIGGGVRQADEIMRSDLLAQNFLSTVVQFETTGNQAIVLGSMIDFVAIEYHHQALIKQMTAPHIRIVSLTVTEGGYYIHPATGLFDDSHPDMVHDANNLSKPITVFGAILTALHIRRSNHIEPFTVMSCDNLPGNGHVVQNTLSGLAKLSGNHELADWFIRHVACPNAMVDRITPATSDRERKILQDYFAIQDARPVFCEPFRQWVLEDHFSLGRPQFELAGVTLTNDVTPYEMTKIRILNGGHAAMAYPSALLGIHFVHDAILHPLIRKYLDKLEYNEIIPILSQYNEINHIAYYQNVINRLENPGVSDTIARLCLDGSNRQPKFIIPSIIDRLKQGGNVIGLAMVSALWTKYCSGQDDQGNVIRLVDEKAAILNMLALKTKHDHLAFIHGLPEIFGDLLDNDQFIKPYQQHINDLWKHGTIYCLEKYI